MFVEGDDEKSVVPLRRTANSLIDLLSPRFTKVDWTGRMHGRETAALVTDIKKIVRTSIRGTLMEMEIAAPISKYAPQG